MPRGQCAAMKNSNALLVLLLASALFLGLRELPTSNRSRDLAWSAFGNVCLDLMPNRVSISRHAAEQGWQAVAEGEEIAPPNRPLRGPHQSWRIDEGGKTIILGIEILGDPATAERMLAGEYSGGTGLLLCNVHFEGGDNEDIAKDISSLSIEGRSLGWRSGYGTGPDGWSTSSWRVSRDGLRTITLAFDPDGDGRFLEASAEIRDW